jgi:hypothetical protein
MESEYIARKFLRKRTLPHEAGRGPEQVASEVTLSWFLSISSRALLNFYAN